MAIRPPRETEGYDRMGHPAERAQVKLLGRRAYARCRADLSQPGRARRASEASRRPASRLAHLREALDRAPQLLRRIAR